MTGIGRERELERAKAMRATRRQLLAIGRPASEVERVVALIYEDLERDDQWNHEERMREVGS